MGRRWRRRPSRVRGAPMSRLLFSAISRRRRSIKCSFLQASRKGCCVSIKACQVGRTGNQFHQAGSACLARIKMNFSAVSRSGPNIPDARPNFSGHDTIAGWLISQASLSSFNFQPTNDFPVLYGPFAICEGGVIMETLGVSLISCRIMLS